jgi:iron complex outermembrane receptor protein
MRLRNTASLPLSGPACRCSPTSNWRADRVRIEADGHARRSFSGLSASAGALFRLNEALHFSAGFDRAERAPNAEELFSDGPHLATNAYEIGDATLNSETARQFEVGLHLHAGPLSGKLAVFRNRIDDFIYQANTGEIEDDLPVLQWSQGDATFRGVEGELEWAMFENASGDWRLRLFGDAVNATLDAGGALPRWRWTGRSRVGAPASTPSATRHRTLSPISKNRPRASAC